jgi:hypothetical protein
MIQLHTLRFDGIFCRCVLSPFAIIIIIIIIIIITTTTTNSD